MHLYLWHTPYSKIRSTHTRPSHLSATSGKLRYPDEPSSPPSHLTHYRVPSTSPKSPTTYASIDSAALHSSIALTSWGHRGHPGYNCSTATPTNVFSMSRSDHSALPHTSIFLSYRCRGHHTTPHRIWAVPTPIQTRAEQTQCHRRIQT